MISDMKTKVEELVNKAAAAQDSGDAMRYSQAALNAAHAFIGMDIQTSKSGNLPA